MFGQLRLFVGTINLLIAVIQSSICPVVIDAGINQQEVDALDDLNDKIGVTTLFKANLSILLWCYFPNN